jgi:hypothetical protein
MRTLPFKKWFITGELLTKDFYITIIQETPKQEKIKFTRRKQT